MNRRHFLQTSVLAATAAAIAPAAWAAPANTLHILHTNDVHSRMDPMPNDGREYGGQGGVVPRAALVKSLRQQYPDLLLLDAGDMVQGTPYFNFFKGEVEMEAMNAMKYDCATLGNHDFDLGLDGLQRMLEIAKFPVVCANYDFGKTALAKRVKPYIVLKRGGRRIGIFGLGIDFAGLVPDYLHGAVRSLEPLAFAREMVQQLRNERCDAIICLSHLGYEYPNNNKISDRILATTVPGIDVIIGGHTHTFLPEPVVVNNTEGKPVLINQVGWSGLYLGHLQLGWSSQGQALATGHTPWQV